MKKHGKSADGYILCRPCAIAYNLVPSQRFNPYGHVYGDAPWRRNLPSPPKTARQAIEEMKLKMQEKYNAKMQLRLAELVAVPINERDAKKKAIEDEVNKEYAEEYQKVVCTCEPAW